jgi:hypothetical protein
MDEQPDRLDTRRALVRGAAAGTLVALLGAGVARGQLGPDRTLLVSVLELEQRLLALYEGASTAQDVPVDTRGLARRFAEQQREHVAILSSALGERPDVADAGDGGGGGPGVVGRAIGLEEQALRSYLDAHQRLRDAALVKAGAGIMANHGQRLVALRDAAGDPPLGDAFAGLG